MARITNIEILQLLEQPVLSIKATISIQDIPNIIGESFVKIGEYIKKFNEIATDIPFVAFHNFQQMDLKSVNIEIGVPVINQLPESGDIKSYIRLSTKVAYCMYQGSNSEMEPVYEEMIKWINDNNYSLVGSTYESYYNGIEYTEEKLLTKVMIPIK